MGIKITFLIKGTRAHAFQTLAPFIFFFLFRTMAGALFHCNGASSTLALSGFNTRRPSSMTSFYRTRVNATAQSQSYWASIEADIEAHLKKAIPVRHPETVFEPMNKLTFAAPRTKAPALCIAACELVGGRQDQAMSAASALHLMHSAAYVHEHLPSTDMLFPKPTIHHAYGPNIELLIGDGIVPFGFELLARSLDRAENNSGRILRVTVEIARAIVSQQGMVNGQYEEILVKISQSKDNERWIEHVCKKKESELYACAAACGAILGGGSEEEIENLRKYGLYAGTIQGIMNGLGGNERRWMKVVEKFRALALKELKNFKDEKVESISSLAEASLCTA